MHHFYFLGEPSYLFEDQELCFATILNIIIHTTDKQNKPFLQVSSFVIMSQYNLQSILSILGEFQGMKVSCLQTGKKKNYKLYYINK